MKDKLTKVLIVDDADSNRYTVGRYLKSAGFEIAEAKTAAEALRMAQEHPALIILDVQLPDMSGFEVCRRLKAAPETASIPVLQTSASFRTVKDKSLGLESGADGYLTSPLEPEELLATVNSLIRMRKAETEAQTLSREWETTFEAINNGLCLVGEDGCIRRYNQAFASLVGKSARELNGKKILVVMAEAGINDYPLQAMWLSQQREYVETRQGDKFLRVTVDPVREAMGKVTGAVCILADITERKKVEMELEEARERTRRHAEELEARVRERTSELQEKNEALQEFCYSIAHDLQAPLRSVNGFTTMLAEEYGEKLDAEGRNYAKRVVASVKWMQDLVKDLLAYGKITHSEIWMGEVDLGQQLQAVLKELKGEIENKNAELVVDGEMPKVSGNASLICQILINLISNALKFVAPGKSPKVTIRSESGAGSVRLWVEDNGIGIAKIQHKKIFQVFERLHSSGSAFPGTGIGLAIVRKAIERMGGDAGVESEPGVGSRFWVDFKKVERNGLVHHKRQREQSEEVKQL